MKPKLETIGENFEEYVSNDEKVPLFITGNAAKILAQLPADSVDFCMTSPPYWGQREYLNGGIGLEDSYQDYIDNLLLVFGQVKRVLKSSGSFWLNMGDTYDAKNLVGIPWRVALVLTDKQGWILRNDVIWNKMKGPDNSRDKLRPVHEYVFHFVKQRKYFYDIDSIRSNPRKVEIRDDGTIVSATGVTGVKYRRRLELSTALSIQEKEKALAALDNVVERMKAGKISDFRMVIRKEHRTTHSDSEKISGRARELAEKGYYFLYYHPDGSKPSDVWDIAPEDSINRGDHHYAVYPQDLCRIPLLATCPENGIALDPFCGTGTTNLVATQLGRKSIGIDLSEQYISFARTRCEVL